MFVKQSMQRVATELARKDSATLRFTKVTLPGKYFPEIQGLEVIIVSRHDDQLAELLELRRYPLDETPGECLSVSMLSDEMAKAESSTIDLLARELEFAATKLRSRN